MKVSLKAITPANFRECVNLKVADDQAAWVAPNVHSLAEAYADRKLKPFAIYDGETLARDPRPGDRIVGFVMVEVWDEVGFIMRLMIGEGFQGKGYGRAATEEVIRRLRLIPEVRSIATSVAPKNEAATKLYESLGFVDGVRPPEDPAEGERYLVLE